jgi:predicted phage tail protein
LCPDCAVEFPQGLACRSRCEEEVQGIIRMIQNSISVSPTASNLLRASRRTAVISASFYMVIGALFAGWGVYEHLSLIVTLGIAFAMFGIITLVRFLRLTRVGPPKT